VKQLQLLAGAFRALRHRDFRLFFAGQGLSLVGTWMQQVGMSWLVYRLTGSAFALGAVGFAAQFPTFIVAPLAGVLADRWNRHRIVLVAQALSMLQALLLAALVLTGAVRVWHVVALAAALGIINGFDIPARQAFLIQLVRGPADLANAIALNSSMFNAARLVGPAVAGLLIAVAGEGLVFLLNGVSYLAVLGALLAMRVAPAAPRGAGTPMLRYFREGLAYAWNFGPIRSLLGLLTLVNLLGVPYIVLMPVFATDVLRGGPHTLGFLTSAAGLGALAGALYLAGRTTVLGLGRVIVVFTLVFGLGLVAFAASRTIPGSLGVLLAVGFGVMVVTASTNTVLQTVVEEDKRGRVMALYTMAFMGMAPVGALLSGALAQRVGAPATVAIGGVAMLGTAAWFARRLPELRREVHPIYHQLGILPEVAQGLQTATELRPR
jgi:MFS family permease